MASLLSQATPNGKLQLAVTAAVSVALTAGAIFGLQALRREEHLSQLKDSIPLLDAEDDTVVPKVSFAYVKHQPLRFLFFIFFIANHRNC
jgi:hypothetical protein